MANIEFNNIYQAIDFCNNIKTYCLYELFFRQIKIVVTNCITKYLY